MGWKKGHAVRLLPFSQANGRVLDIYRDVQHVFGVPHVSSFFQYLGTNPRFLDSFWTAIRPIAETEEFFSCAHRLRADAYNRVQSNFAVPSLRPELARQQFSLGACQELKDCINFFCYSVPVTLLLASFLSKSFRGTAGNPALPRTPAPAPKPHRHIVLIDEETAPSTVKSIFADIRFATGADVIHTVYRAFARWPDFLQSYWAAVKPIAVSEPFQQCETAMREGAIQIVKEVPGPIEFNSNELAKVGVNPTETGSLIDITAMFVHSLAAALLNVSVARIALEGGSPTKSSLEDSETTPPPKAEILR
jgi:hypothetical protein